MIFRKASIFGPSSKERATQPGVRAKRWSKSQSLNDEEGEGLFSPWCRGFLPTEDALCLRWGVCNSWILWLPLWSKRETQFSQWLGALCWWWGRAVLQIFTVLRAELDTGQSPLRHGPVIPWQKVGWWKTDIVVGSPITLCWKEQGDLQSVLWRLLLFAAVETKPPLRDALAGGHGGASTCYCVSAGTCCLGIFPWLLRPELTEPRSSGTSAPQAANFPNIVPLC